MDLLTCAANLPQDAPRSDPQRSEDTRSGSAAQRRLD